MKVIQSIDNPGVYLQILEPRETCVDVDLSCTSVTWIPMSQDIHWDCQ